MANEIQKVGEEFNLANLFNKAIEKDASVDTLERLMKIREDIKKEKAKEEFYSALKELQANLPDIPPDCVVKNKDGSIRYKYASLKRIMDYIQPILTQYGFSITFETEKNNKELNVICYLRHTSGHIEKSTFTIPMDTSQYMSDIQRMGSTLTYAKRYALTSMLNITTSDDTDGIETEVEMKQETAKATPVSTPDKPSINQLKIYYIKLGNIGVSKEEAKELLKYAYNTNTLKDLTKEQFEELMGYVNDMEDREDFDNFLNTLKNEE